VRGRAGCSGTSVGCKLSRGASASEVAVISIGIGGAP